MLRWTEFPSEESAPRSGVVLPIHGSFGGGSRHWLHCPTFRLYWYSVSPLGQGGVLLQVLVWVRLGQLAPPYSGAARTARVRYWRPTPQVLLQSDQAENSDTTQSKGQGMRQACSSVGFWEKESQTRSATTLRLDLRTHWTLRR